VAQQLFTWGLHRPKNPRGGWGGGPGGGGGGKTTDAVRPLVVFGTEGRPFLRCASGAPEPQSAVTDRGACTSLTRNASPSFRLLKGSNGILRGALILVLSPIAGFGIGNVSVIRAVSRWAVIFFVGTAAAFVIWRLV